MTTRRNVKALFKPDGVQRPHTERHTLFRQFTDGSASRLSASETQYEPIAAFIKCKERETGINRRRGNDDPIKAFLKGVGQVRQLPG